MIKIKIYIWSYRVRHTSTETILTKMKQETILIKMYYALCKYAVSDNKQLVN